MIRVDLYGRGLSFPIRVGLDGRLAVRGELNVRESICILLRTARLERVERASYGCGVGQYIYDTSDLATLRLIQDEVQRAIVTWEPRVALDDVLLTTNPEDQRGCGHHRCLHPRRDRSRRAQWTRRCGVDEMPMTVPNLDNRTFDDLYREVRARVAVHTPEWTNLNDSDPGVTLLQLFTFLADNLSYRSNRIPEATRYHVPHAPRHGAAAGDCGERAGDVQCRRTDHGARRRRSSAPARSGSVRDARCRRCRSRHTCCGSARTPTWTTRPSSTCAGCTSRSSEPTARIS